MGIGLTILFCRQCRDPVPRHYAVGGLCYSCHLDSYVPADYQHRERYRPDAVWRHLNATRRPPLGVPFLDEGGGRVQRALPPLRWRPSPRRPGP